MFRHIVSTVTVSYCGHLYRCPHRGFTFQRLVHQRVHGLGDAYDSCEHDAPPVSGEAVGGRDSDQAEQQADAECGQGGEAFGDVLLERLDQGRGDEGDDGCGQGGRVGDVHHGFLPVVGCRSVADPLAGIDEVGVGDAVGPRHGLPVAGEHAAEAVAGLDDVDTATRITGGYG